MSIKIDVAMKAYMAIRAAIEVENRKAKDFAAEHKPTMEKLELHIMKLFNELGTDSFKVKDVGTVFKAKKDSVTVGDKEEFKSFLAKQFLMNLQPYIYTTSDGKWQPDGKGDLQEHVDKILDSGTFDLLTVAANKINCKSYMEDNKGLMPDGVDYFSETVVQFRKGK